MEYGPCGCRRSAPSIWTLSRTPCSARFTPASENMTLFITRRWGHHCFPFSRASLERKRWSRSRAWIGNGKNGHGLRGGSYRSASGPLRHCLPNNRRLALLGGLLWVALQQEDRICSKRDSAAKTAFFTAFETTRTRAIAVRALSRTIFNGKKLSFAYRC